MTDPVPFLAAALAATEAAGQALLPWFRSSVAVAEKSDHSPVTIADRDAERAIRAVLSAHHPDHGLLGEEEGLQNPDAPLRWVFDPIDGTRAFITGRPSFTTLIALLEGDVPILGVINQPITGERWIGLRGHPTRFESPLGGVAGVRTRADLAQAELSCTAPEIFPAADLPRFQKLAASCRRVSWGGDAYAYGLLALGQIDIICEATLNLWDWAALVPVIEGAGGAITDWNGKALTPQSSGHALAVGDRGLLSAAVKTLT